MLIFCWRDLWALLCILIGIASGALPLIIHNVNAQSGTDSWSVFQATSGSSASIDVWLHIQKSLLTAIPVITVFRPSCLIREIPYPHKPHALSCVVMQNSWGIGFLFLLVLAAVMALVTIYLTQKQSHLPYTTQQRRTLVYASAKILLVLSAFLTLYFFIKGTALKLDPVNSARYLICLWLSLPVALWPLWPGNSSIFYQSIVWQRLFVLAKCAVLLLVLSGFAMSTFNIFHSALPVAQRINQQQQNLISSMRQQHITHFYTDYWTCYNIAVLTQEKMICATVNDSLDLVGNRYKPYMFAVQDANYPAYVFKKGSKTITLLEQRFQKEHTAFTRTETETYVILRVGRGEAGR